MDNSAFVIFDETSETGRNRPALPPDKEKEYSFEEAASLTGIGKFHYFLMLVCGLCFMTVMMETMGIGIMVPYLKCDLDSTIAEQGFVLSSGFLGVVVSSHMMGFFADTWGRVKTLRTALFCGFITTVISAFSVNTWMLIVFRFLNGVSISGCQACVFSFLGEFNSQKTRVRYITMLSMFLPIGLMILPCVAMFILPLKFSIDFIFLQFTSWRALLLMNTSFNIVALSGLLLLPESPKYDLIQGNHENALRTFRKMFTWNTGRPAIEYPVKKFKVELVGANLGNIKGIKGALGLIWSQTVPLFSRERVFQTLNICGIMFIVFAVSQGCFMWFPTMLDQIVENSSSGLLVCQIMDMYGTQSKNSTDIDVECGGSGNNRIFLILIAVSAVFVVVYLLFTFIVETIGKKNLLVSYMVIAAVSCLAIHWTSSFTLSVIILTLILTTGTCGGIVSSISIEYFPTNINAMAMCLTMMCARLGAVVGSNIIGLVVFSNCDLLFYIFFALIIMTGICSMLLPEKIKAKNNNKDECDVKKRIKALKSI